jgi:membrane-bound lytic murein transglycosylase B
VATAKSQEDAIRRYLTYINNPDELVDQGQIETLQQKLSESHDPVERIKLRNEIERTKQPPADELEAEFVRVAKQWAEQHGISAEALRAEGVKPAVLRKAGFTIGQSTRKRTTAAKRTGKSRQRASKEDVIQHLTSQPNGNEFTLNDVMDATGASRSTVNQVISRLTEEGKVKKVGKAEHTGPGRAPDLFQVE